MLLSKQNPVGIDWYIQNVQTRLYSALMSAWGNVSYNCYGRIYRNRGEVNGYIAEAYTGNGEYQEVFWDSALDAISYFYDYSIQKTGSESKAAIGLIFFCNLATLKPSILHRADEEVRMDVANAVGTSSFQLHHIETVRGIDDVLKEFPGSRRDDRLKFVDMHPVHSFRLNYSILFDPNKNLNSNNPYKIN